MILGRYIWDVLGLLGTLASLYTTALVLLDRLGFYSWWGIYIRSRQLVNKIKASGYSPDLVVGIGRSGAILGGILAGNLGVLPITVVDREYIWHEGTRHVKPLMFVKQEEIKGKKILLVDAAPHTGETSKIIKDKLNEFNPAELKLAYLFKTRYVLQKPDFYVKDVKKVRTMPWRFSADYREDFAALSD